MAQRLSPAILALILVAAACGSTGPPPSPAVASAAPTASAAATSTPLATAAPTPSASAGLAALKWIESGRVEVTRLKAPLDYGNPSAGTISLSVARRQAGDPTHRIGTLFLNPGGPGGSGVEFLRGPDPDKWIPKAVLDRFDLVAGDLRTDDFPGGHELAFVSAIVHMLGPAGNVALFRKVHDALVPGGRVVIRDHVMSADRTAPRSGALFAVNMLVGTEEGGTFTFEEIAAWLVEAGFGRPRLVRGGERMDALVEAYRP